ncbi:hypothetical protein B0H13DRAFT_2456825, partial [Mycena leptocephala]
LDILYRSVVAEALHDSGERFTEPACHPGTRTAILNDLRAWVLDTSPESALLWLHGSAGSGKSAIAQMFAGDCQTRDRLGASFFFKRGHAKRGTWTRLFTTLAYQLATSVSEFLFPIQQAIDKDKLIFGRAVPVQFRRLILEPLGRATTLQFRPIVVLDGLDECEDHKIQQQILRLFIGAIRTGHLPIRILVVSRPEPHLREVLETQEALRMCRRVQLCADKSAYDDVRIYLQDEFTRIYSQYSARGIDLGAPWHPAGALDYLVQKSSGIFIYAATVIKFIDDEYFHPDDRLASVLQLDPESTAPLDELYTEILSIVPQESYIVLLILHSISTARFSMPLDPEGIDMLLNLRPGTCRLKLRHLHSLISLPPIASRLVCRGGTTFLHASLCDYLCDAHRSGRWCVSTPQLKLDYLHCIIRMLSSPPQNNATANIYSGVVYGLDKLLGEVPPSEALMTVMRNHHFQES